MVSDADGSTHDVRTVSISPGEGEALSRWVLRENATRTIEVGHRFDLAFVDGNHRFDAVFLDLFYLGRLLPKGGVILLDDYDLPGIRRAVSFYLNNLDWRVEEVSATDDAHHWVALRTAATEDTRHFRYFVDF